MRAFIGVDLKNYKETFDIDFDSSLRKTPHHHLTIYFFPSLSEDKAQELKEKPSSFSFPSFTLKATKILAFPSSKNPSLLALGFEDSSSINKLYNTLTQHLNLPKEPFTPHITLVRKKNLQANFKEGSEQLNEILPINIEINHIGLFQSIQTEEGRTYPCLKRVDLG